MRKFHGLVFLGAGEWSVAAARLLHLDLPMREDDEYLEDPSIS